MICPDSDEWKVYLGEVSGLGAFTSKVSDRTGATLSRMKMPVRWSVQERRWQVARRHRPRWCLFAFSILRVTRPLWSAKPFSEGCAPSENITS